MPTLERKRMSYDAYCALPEEIRAEWVDGEVVEILSRSTRSEDTVRISGEYLAGGPGQYWIVAPVDRSIDVFANRGTAWDALARIDEASPEATVSVTPEVAVDVRLAELLD